MSLTKLWNKKYLQEEGAEEAPGGSVDTGGEEAVEGEFSASDVNDLISEDEEEGFVDEVSEPDGEEEPTADEPPQGEEVADEGEPETPAEESKAEEPEPPKAEETPTPESEEQQPQVPETTQLTPEQQAEQRAQVEADLRSGLENYYQLSEEDAELASVEPDKVLPKLAANLHIQVLQAATQGILAQLPQLVNGVIEARTVNTQSEDAFYTEWPALKDHGDTVQRIAATYRALNPSAPTDKAIKEIGAQAMFMLGIPVEQAPAEPEVPPMTPPPVPAAPGGSTNPPVAPVRSDNPFEQMAEEFDEEDY